MLVAETVLGHRDEPDVAARIRDAEPESVVLSDADRRRSRLRTETTGGQDLGIIVGDLLCDGDVLETTTGHLVIVELAEIEALVVNIGDSNLSPEAALEWGHTIGNRHWSLAVHNHKALIPVGDSPEQLETVVREQLPEDIPLYRTTVPPSTFDDTGYEHHDGDGSHAHSDRRGHGGRND